MSDPIPTIAEALAALATLAKHSEGFDDQIDDIRQALEHAALAGLVRDAFRSGYLAGSEARSVVDTELAGLLLDMGNVRWFIDAARESLTTAPTKDEALAALNRIEVFIRAASKGDK